MFSISEFSHSRRINGETVEELLTPSSFPITFGPQVSVNFGHDTVNTLQKIYVEKYSQ